MRVSRVVTECVPRVFVGWVDVSVWCGFFLSFSSVCILSFILCIVAVISATVFCSSCTSVSSICFDSFCGAGVIEGVLVSDGDEDDLGFGDGCCSDDDDDGDDGGDVDGVDSGDVDDVDSVGSGVVDVDDPDWEEGLDLDVVLVVIVCVCVVSDSVDPDTVVSVGGSFFFWDFCSVFRALLLWAFNTLSLLSLTLSYAARYSCHGVPFSNLHLGSQLSFFDPTHLILSMSSPPNFFSSTMQSGTHFLAFLVFGLGAVTDAMVALPWRVAATQKWSSSRLRRTGAQ